MNGEWSAVTIPALVGEGVGYYVTFECGVKIDGPRSTERVDGMYRFSCWRSFSPHTREIIKQAFPSAVFDAPRRVFLSEEDLAHIVLAAS